MSEIAANKIKSYQSYPPAVRVTAQNNSVPPSYAAAASPQGMQIYEYPQTSIYNPQDKKTSGLNIYVFNPAGAGAPSTINNNFPHQPHIGAAAAAPIANTSIMKKDEAEKSGKKKKKPVIKLTDDYIKTLESFLRSGDKAIRKQGIIDLIKRFEEDDSRYENPSLTALLNIALQDFDVQNRMLALSPIDSGSAHGDENTVKIVKKLTESDKLYGQEAKAALKALLKTSQTRRET